MCNITVVPGYSLQISLYPYICFVCTNP